MSVIDAALERLRAELAYVNRLRKNAVARAEKAEAAIARVRELHTSVYLGMGNEGCRCGVIWPCPTVRALDDPEVTE